MTITKTCGVTAGAGRSRGSVGSASVADGGETVGLDITAGVVSGGLPPQATIDASNIAQAGNVTRRRALRITSR